MKIRPHHILTLTFAGLLLAWFFWQTRDRPPHPEPPSETTTIGLESAGRNGKDPAPAPTEVWSLSLSELNRAGGSIQNDLRILDATFGQWLSNFPTTGNPVGTNAAITAALTGNNPLELDLIPADNPAINRSGELCDRWGTPFRFHQLSGSVMEIISAGPDRTFGTADDVNSAGS